MLENLGLDLDNLDMEIGEDDIDSLDLNNFGVVDDVIEQPHLKLDTKEFNEVLKTAKQVVATSARDVVSKSLCLVREGDKVKVYATDFDVYLEYSLDLLNTENILDEPVIVPLDILQKLIKAVPASFVIFKDGENLMLKLVGGDIILESHQVDITKFQFTSPLDKEANVSANEVYSIIKDFTPIVTSAVSPTERRVIFDDESAISTYMWSMIVAKSNFSPMDLKVKDISVLKTLLANKDEDLETYITGVDEKVVRKQIKGSNFSYTFLLSDVGVQQTLKESFDALNIQNGTYIDLLQLYKMVELSSELPYAVGKVGLNYNEDGQLTLSIKTKKSKDSDFVIEGSVEGSVSPLNEELVLQAKLLKILLRAFKSSSTVKLCVTEKGLAIVTDAYTGVLFSENL